MGRVMGGLRSITLRSVTLRGVTLRRSIVHCLRMMLHLNHLGILEVVVYLFHISLSVLCKFFPYDVFVFIHSDSNFLLDTLVHEHLELLICENFSWCSFNWLFNNNWSLNHWCFNLDWLDLDVAYIRYCLDNVEFLLMKFI